MKSKPALKKILWKWFSLFIRLRDTKGHWTECISCWKAIDFGTIDCQAGHFISKSQCPKPSMIFNEKNVNAQCSRCNKWLGGNQEAYRKGMIKKYGSKIIGELEIKRNIRSEPWQRFHYEILIKEYKNKVQKLKGAYL